MYFLSFTSTLRTIVVLVIIWMLMRWIMRRTGRSAAGPQRVAPDGRAPGDVRIERSDRPVAGPVQDADFEEIN